MVRELFSNRKSYSIAAGGSSTLGVLGHINAVFELQAQIERKEIPAPSTIIVGAGTCGTMAGLLAGMRLTGMKTQVIGVRCVDPIVCNPYHIASLSNATLRALKSRARISYRDVDLRDPGEIRYGEALSGGEELIAEMREVAGIELDTTYTSKVFSFLKSHLPELQGQNVLYWHTFSPGALNTARVGKRLYQESAAVS
jgi:1-aminocyclopropane-1-carboxylate deaminase/D-cysteine desulfhydrase-like pyridoxal-dependent ACC family enzyme